MPFRSLHSMTMLFAFMCWVSGTSQTIVWQETFDGTGNWGTLNQSVGSEGCNANPFYISCQENGNAVGSCGSGCAGNNTLHVASVAYGDIGAAYDAGGGPACGGLLNCLFGGLCNTTTDRRSRSALISTLGYSDLDLEFDYIESGSGSADNALVEYSTNGGGNWTTLMDMPKTVNAGCGGQGRWTHISIPLPTTCDNIADLMIAFRWRNNNDAAGTDPSFAVNDVMITQPTILPVELISFEAGMHSGTVKLTWTTASETNNSHFIIERALADSPFEAIGRVEGSGITSILTDYRWYDHRPLRGMSYYRLKQVDYNGHGQYVGIVSVEFTSIDPIQSWILSNGMLDVVLNQTRTVEFRLLDIHGREIRSGMFVNGQLHIPIDGLSAGCYILRTIIPGRPHIRKFVVD